MSKADEKRGEALAELARQFLLWLETNELPGVPGLKDAQLYDFELYAGIYRRVEPLRGKRLLPQIWSDQPEERNRLFGLGLGISHVLLVDNPNDDVTLPDGRTVGRNRIVARVDRSLDQAGALITVEPRLDSMLADEATLGIVRNADFGTVLARADLAYDDAPAGAQALFRYPFIFTYEAPRRAHQRNVRDVLVPAELDPGPVNNHDQVLARRVRTFREHLQFNATYHNHGGDYYKKWRAKEALNSKQRQFRPTLLSNDYLNECFIELVMKRGDDLLLINLPRSRHLYRLLWEVRPGFARLVVRFTVQPLLTVGDPSDPASPPGRGQGKSGPPLPVTAVFFHALDGADRLPSRFRIGKLNYKGGLPQRFVVDYKAYLRWYFDDARLDYGNDEEWFARFVDVFFGDQLYPIQPVVLPAHKPDREALFLQALRHAASQEPAGPLKERLAELVAWCEADEWRFVFTQGMTLGTKDNPRELIGVTPRGDVLEWHPATELVTTMKLTAWLEDIRIGTLAAEVYRSTAGLLPIITFITWGGVIVMSGGSLSVPASMTTLARTTVVQLSQQVAGKLITKEAARKARPFLVAALVEGVMGLIPKTDALLYEFIRGFFQGYGGGAVEHYLSEADERLERMIDKVPAMVANKLTKNGYRAYVIYEKVRNALAKISGAVKALRTVLVDARAKLVAQELGRLSQYVGHAFLIILFVVVYLDWVYRSRPAVAADKWVEKQRQTLKWMVVETQNEIKDYARALKNDLLAHRQDLRSPAATAVVRKHDQRLAAAIAAKLQGGVAAVPAVADFLQLLLGEMGVENWQELQRLGFTEVMARGVSALASRGLALDQARKLGAAVGELIGTIMLERRIVPQSAHANTGILFDKKQTARATKTALAGGTWRALWQFAIYPFENLGELPGSLKRGLEDQAGRKNTALTPVQHRDTGYRDFVRNLLGDEEELARRLAKLAADEGLEAKLEVMIKSALDGKVPPALDDLVKTENDEWPTEAILFLLYSWLRLGLHQLLEVFNLIEDDKPYGGAFKLSQLLDIIGLDIPLDDKTVAALRAKFTRTTTP